MKRDALRLMRSIYRANKHQNRTEHLETFLDELELLVRHESARPLVAESATGKAQPSAFRT